MSLISDTFILDDAEKMDQILEENSVDLSIIKFPYHRLENNPNNHIQFIKNIIKKVTKITKIGGICCMIISDDMTKDGIMDMTETRAWIKVQDDPEIGPKWIFREKILWTKSSQKSAKSFLSTKEIQAVSFDLTPFSTIWIMIRSDNDDCDDLDIANRIMQLKLSEVKKQEMLDLMWFIPPKSEYGYKDHLPKELILRLLMIFSRENDLVLDPFSGNGITAIACKTLDRYFVCIEKNQQYIDLAKKRFKEFSQSK